MASEQEVVASFCRRAWGTEPSAWKPFRAPGGRQFASSLVKGTLTLELPVVVKVQPPEASKRYIMNSDAQFHNEVTVYRDLLPLLGMRGLTARMYLGVATNGERPDEDVIALEALRGFEPCRRSPFLDAPHFRLALRALGKFHAASFSEAGRREILREKASILKATGFGVKNPETIAPWMRACLMRGIDALPSRSEDVRAFAEAVETRLPEVVALLEGSGEAADSVLLHGDFCSNNLVFSYSEDGSPSDVRFVDFQNSKWGGPSIDLAFFLYLNTSAETRSSSFDRLLDVYLDSLEASLGPDSVYPGREEVLREFASNAPYGYLHCSFFLPVMLAPTPPLWDSGLDPCSQESIAVTTALGGQESTAALAAVVQHLDARGYLGRFLARLNRV